MRALRSAVLGVVTVAAALAACGDDDAGAPTIGRLDGSTFASTSVEGHEMVAGTNVTMTFDADGVAVQGGCNTLRGAVSIDGDTLQVGPMAQTMMACTDDLMEQDTFLAGFLTAGPTIALDDATLTLVGQGATIIAALTAG